MKINITKRDIGFFFLGILALFVFEIIWDWDRHIESFWEGYERGAVIEKNLN